MTLLPEIAEVVRHLPPADGARPDPVAARAAEQAQVVPVADRLPLFAVEDRTVPTSTGEVPVRVYTPEEADSYALLVYLHGGAFFLGSLDSHDHVARELARATGCRVVAVGYRLAPEHRYPAGLDDCHAVVRWAAEHGRDELSWNGSGLTVAGDSSGATFAAAVAARAHDEGWDRISAQVLLYPSLDLDFDLDRYPSLRENARGYGLETAGLAPWNSYYVESGADPADPEVSPIKRPDLTGLPPALVVTAEYDPLRDEGERYAERLAAAGVRVRSSRYAGVNHGFVTHFSWVPEVHRVYDEVAEFLTTSGAGGGLPA